MSRRRWACVVAGAALLVGVPATAQVMTAPGPIPGPMLTVPAQSSVAEFLLANTGELHLTDQQVTRLAAIARRAESQRQSLRATMDSMMDAARARPDSAPRRQGALRGPDAPPAAFQRLRAQSHADLRDALTVLNPDQLATAWELMARRTMLVGAQARAAAVGRLRRPGVMGPERGRMIQPPGAPEPPSPPRPPSAPQPPANPPQPPS